VGLLEVPALFLGSRDYSLDQGSVLLNGYPLEQLVLRGRGGSRVHSLHSLIMYPKRVHFASLMLAANYWGPDGWHP
jgi:hypothetical protein